MALKLASLAQGASGVRPETLALLEAMLDARRDPGRAGQGSVGASGDLAPLAHMAAAMIGVGEVAWIGERVAAGGRGARRGRAQAARARRRRKGWRCSTARSSRPPTRWPACSRLKRCSHRRWSPGALSTDAARGSDTPFDPRIHACAAIAARSRRPRRLRALMAGSADPRLASHRRRARAGPLLPALPAAGDGRGARSAAPGGGDARDEAERRLRQSADLRRATTRRSRAAISTPSRSPSPPT